MTTIIDIVDVALSIQNLLYVLEHWNRQESLNETGFGDVPNNPGRKIGLVLEESPERRMFVNRPKNTSRDGLLQSLWFRTIFRQTV